jgi:tetratricopeptide (TPR) repeat protein
MFSRIKNVLKFVALGFLGLFIFLLVLGSIINKNEANKKFPELAAQGIAFFEEGKYEDAVTVLSEALTYKKDDELKGKLDQAKALISSAQAFEEGMAAFNENNLSLAKMNFGKVIPTDVENYSNAQERLVEIPALIANDCLAKAKELYTQKEYIKAFDELNNALKHNLDLSEASTLLPTYEKQKNAQEEQEKKAAAAQEKQAAIEAMKKYESGTGPIAIAAEVKITETFNDGYTTYYSKDKKSWYVRIHVSAANNGNRTEHVNPHHFTLITPGGYTINVDDNTYSLSNYFDATDLQPNTYTSGWLVFFAPKADYYRLQFESMTSKVSKKIIY